MTTHVLIACSKSKSIQASNGLTWNAKTNTKSWSKKWHSAEPRSTVQQLYTGRSFQTQLNTSASTSGVETYVISAGAGLIRVSDEVRIPSYEAMFRTSLGPVSSEWHLLPEGGLKNLSTRSGEEVVSFAPPQYHRALAKDPRIGDIASHLVVASTSPLASIAGTVIEIHPRAKEVLSVASTDLNSEILKLYLHGGIEELRKVHNAGNLLPPKPERTAISDEELFELISGLTHLVTLDGVVRHLRDDLLIKASVERITRARKSIMGN